MKKITIAILTLSILAIASIIHAEKKQDIPGFAWANGLIYNAQYSSSQKPADGARNTLYVFDGLKGQRPVAEPAPAILIITMDGGRLFFSNLLPPGKRYSISITMVIPNSRSPVGKWPSII